jgi:hypothetical protein
VLRQLTFVDTEAIFNLSRTQFAERRRQLTRLEAFAARGDSEVSRSFFSPSVEVYALGLKTKIGTQPRRDIINCEFADTEYPADLTPHEPKQFVKRRTTAKACGYRLEVTLYLAQDRPGNSVLVRMPLSAREHREACVLDCSLEITAVAKELEFTVRTRTKLTNVARHHIGKPAGVCHSRLAGGFRQAGSEANTSSHSESCERGPNDTRVRGAGPERKIFVSHTKACKAPHPLQPIVRRRASRPCVSRLLHSPWLS